MEARMRKALESVLFFDETTPVKELIGRCASRPLHLSEKPARCSPDQARSLPYGTKRNRTPFLRPTSIRSRATQACHGRALCCACRAASTGFL